MNALTYLIQASDLVAKAATALLNEQRDIQLAERATGVAQSIDILATAVAREYTPRG